MGDNRLDQTKQKETHQNQSGSKRFEILFFRGLNVGDTLQRVFSHSYIFLFDFNSPTGGIDIFLLHS